MSFQARIHDLITGQFLLSCRVEAASLHDAERSAITHAAKAMHYLPQDIVVRHLHQCTQIRVVTPQLGEDD